MMAHEVAAALGGGRREGQQWRVRCPAHGGRSLYLADGRDGALLVRCFGGCDWRDVFAELRSLGLIESRAADPGRLAAVRVREEVSALTDIERLARRIARARDLYRRSKPAPGTAADTYLRSRGITLAAPPGLRFLNPCPHRNGCCYPAMMAPIVNVRGEQVAIHKTFLRIDGSSKTDLPKREQREVCGPMRGGAVRLAQHNGSELIIGEGIESTLSAMQMFGLPGWAAICASNIEALDLPTEVRRIAIAADNDAGRTGQRAALVAHRRWTAEGRAVRILLPPHVGQDFNDVLLAR